MPSMRVTVASNVNQTLRKPVLLPLSAVTDPKSKSSYLSHTLKAAKDKLNLKKPTRVFVYGGQELVDQEDWESRLRNDVVLLVSTGEDYVGNRTQASDQLHPDANPNCTITLIAEKALIDPNAVKQLENTAHTLPGLIHAIGQPDLHVGNKFPIGAVFVSKDWIHPPLIGGDIGCGMAWYKTALSRSQVEGDKGRKIADRLKGLEGPWRTKVEREVWLAEGSGICGARDEWDKSLGTVGAGNHFAELQVVEKSSMPRDEKDSDECRYQLHDSEVVLLVHSGSRGLGGHVLEQFTQSGLNSMHKDEANAQKYLAAHDRACTWAQRNRNLIALRFLACFEPNDPAWQLGSRVSTHAEGIEEEVREAFQAVQNRKVMEIHHNNIEHTGWSEASHEVLEGRSTDLPQKVFIHRKGAAPTHNPADRTALSILPLPGSRATPTLILHPTFTAKNTYGRTNAFSLAHGAGRAMSRVKAATWVSQKYEGKADDLLRGDYVKADKQGNKKVTGGGGSDGRSVHGGCWVVCEDKELVWEEAPEAYKDVWDVADDLVKSGCCEVWGWCRPLVSYKIRRE